MLKEPQEELNELKKRELQLRHARAVKYCLQGIKYIMGFLPDYAFDLRPEFMKNPLQITLRIYWGEEDYNWEQMSTIMKERIQKLEESLAHIGHPVGNIEVSEPIHENGTN